AHTVSLGPAPEETTWHARSFTRGVRLPAPLRRRQPLLRLDDRSGAASAPASGRNRQPLHQAPTPGRVRTPGTGRRPLGGAARGGTDQEALAGREDGTHRRLSAFVPASA